LIDSISKLAPLNGVVNKAETAAAPANAPSAPVDLMSTNLLGSKPAIDPHQAITDFSRPLTRLGSGYTPQVSDLSDLIDSSMQLGQTVPANFNISQVSVNLNVTN
jgi:hypothetical protein